MPQPAHAFAVIDHVFRAIGLDKSNVIARLVHLVPELPEEFVEQPLLLVVDNAIVGYSVQNVREVLEDSQMFLQETVDMAMWNLLGLLEKIEQILQDALRLVDAFDELNTAAIPPAQFRVVFVHAAPPTASPEIAALGRRPVPPPA